MIEVSCLLRLEGVTKSFRANPNPVEALRGITLEIKAAEKKRRRTRKSCQPGLQIWTLKSCQKSSKLFMTTLIS